MTKITNLNAERAHREGDSRLWSPIDMVEQLLADLKSGEINPEEIIVHFFEPSDPKKPEGKKRHGYAVAGVTYPSHIALLTVAKTRVVADWLGDE